MTDKLQISPPTADETQTVKGNMRGDSGPAWGNEYDHHRHESPERVRVGANDGGTPAEGGAAQDDGGELPPETGRRAWVDQRTGEVHGSGAPAEDIDRDITPEIY